MNCKDWNKRQLTTSTCVNSFFLHCQRSCGQTVLGPKTKRVVTSNTGRTVTYSCVTGQGLQVG